MLRKIKRNFKRNFKKVSLGTAAAVTVAAGNAQAAIDWTGVDLSTGDVDSIAGKVVLGLAVLWGLRKVVKTMNRS